MNESNVSLNSFDYCKYWEPDTDFEKIAKQTAIVLLTLAGISLNIFVIILAAKFTVRKNLHHLIINMAVSDAVFLFVRFWYYFPWVSGNKWRICPSGMLGVIFCKTTVFLFESSYMVSLITLLIISIERARATRQRLQRSRQYTLKRRLLVIGCSWLISTPFGVFNAIEAKVYNDGKVCYAGWVAYEVQPIIIYMSNFSVIAILCSVIFFLSILTIRRLIKHQAIQSHLSEEQRNERARRTQAAVRMVLASVLLYVFCWLPYSVYTVLNLVNFLIPSANIFSGCFDRQSLSFIVNYMLPAISSCFSPWIYIIFLSDFRQAANKVFCRRNILNSFELQPVPRRRRNCQEEDIEL